MDLTNIQTSVYNFDESGTCIIIIHNEEVGQCRYYRNNQQITFDEMNNIRYGNLTKWIDVMVNKNIVLSNLKLKIK